VEVEEKNCRAKHTGGKKTAKYYWGVRPHLGAHKRGKKKKESRGGKRRKPKTKRGTYGHH